VQISSIGAGAGAGARPRAGTDETFAAYLRAKTEAEEDLRRRDLDWTVLRPRRAHQRAGDGPGTAGGLVPRAQISRADVAAVIVGLATDARASAGPWSSPRGTLRSSTPSGSCGTASPGRPLETRCHEPGTLITGQTKLLTTPMSVAAPAAKAAATSSSLSKSPLPLLSNASTAAA
jgi:NAD(P)H-binding